MHAYAQLGCAMLANKTSAAHRKAPLSPLGLWPRLLGTSIDCLPSFTNLGTLAYALLGCAMLANKHMYLQRLFAQLGKR